MQTAIVEIKHGGKAIPLKCSYNAIMRMEEETGLTIQDMDRSGGNLKAMESLFYWSAVSGFRGRGQEIPFAREDSPYIWEDHAGEFMNLVADVFKAQADNGTAKKKSVKT